jgi:hypothetical protein
MTNLTQVENKLMGMAFPNMKSLKVFKLEIKRLGYRVRTHKGGVYETLIFLEVLDKGGEFVVGSGANVYSSETIKKHQKVFDLLNKNMGKVYDTDYNPPIKVLF